MLWLKFRAKSAVFAKLKNVGGNFLRPKKSHIALAISIVSLASLIYLVKWDRQGSYPGYYEIDFMFGAIPNLAILALFISFLIAIWLVRNSRIYIPTVVIPLLTLAYFSRLNHGVKIASFETCDMSICDKLAIYPDGSYYFRSSSQNETLTHWGEYWLKNDTLILSKSSANSKLRTQDLDFIKSQNCIFIKTEGFHTQLSIKQCK